MRLFLLTFVSLLMLVACSTDRLVSESAEAIPTISPSPNVIVTYQAVRDSKTATSIAHKADVTKTAIAKSTLITNTPTKVPSLTPTITLTPDMAIKAQGIDAVYNDLTSYTQPDFGIRFEYPRVFSGGDCAPEMRNGRIDIGDRLSITMHDSEGLGLAAFLDKHYDDVLFGQVTSSKQVKIAGEPASYLEIADFGYSFANVILHNNKIYILLFVGKPGCDLDWNRPIDDYLYNTVLKTFEFTEISSPVNPQPDTVETIADPAQFVKDYFSLINNRQYEKAWEKLSPRFQESLSTNGGYDGYVSFWDTVDTVDIVLIEVRSQAPDYVYINTEINYHYKAGHTTTSHTTYKLVKDPFNSSWLFGTN